MLQTNSVSFIAFDKEFTFQTYRTLQEAAHLAIDCDSLQEFESLLQAEDVDYKTVDTKFVEPNDSTSYYQMSLL